MSRRLGGLDGRRLTGSLARITIGGSLTAMVAVLVSTGVDRALPGESVASLALQVTLSVVAGLVVFLGSAYLFRMEELGLMKSSLPVRFKK